MNYKISYEILYVRVVNLHSQTQFSTIIGV